jgi:hypothetical protein
MLTTWLDQGQHSPLATVQRFGSSSHGFGLSATHQLHVAVHHVWREKYFWAVVSMFANVQPHFGLLTKQQALSFMC